MKQPNLKEIRKKLTDALSQVEEELRDSQHGDRYSRGLSTEGYVGGYRDCLMDLQLLLNGVKPKRRNYWR